MAKKRVKHNLAVQHLHVSDNNDLRVKFSHLIKLDFDKLKNRKKFLRLKRLYGLKFYLSKLTSKGGSLVNNFRVKF